jgi:hypothetical protein
MSIAVARYESIELVADVVFSFGIVNLIATTLSLGLRSHLGLWSFRYFPESTFVANRAYGATFSLLLSASVLYVLGIPTFVIAATTLIKLADLIADIQFGLALARGRIERALDRLAMWSLLRFGVFIGMYGLALLATPNHATALVWAASVQALFSLLPWIRKALAAIATSSPTVVLKLTRTSLPLAVAAVTSGLLTTFPRLMIDAAYDSQGRGHAGVTLIVGTFFGMAFNTLWVRTSVTHQLRGRVVAIRRFSAEGVVISTSLLILLFATGDLVAQIYGVTHEAFHSTFLHLGTALVAFFLAMSATNFLKATKQPINESIVQVGAALAFWVAIMITHNMATALYVSSALMLGAVFVLLRGDSE